MSEIKPRWVDGEPVCDRDCSEYGPNDHCMSRSQGCWLRKVNPCYYTPCIPALREQRDEARAEVERLEKEKEEIIEEAASIISDFAGCDYDLALKDFRAILAKED